MSDSVPAPCFHGRIESGRLKLDDREKFAGLVHKLEGQQISISLKKFRRGRSNAQNAWYWSGILPVMAEHLGYEVDELHAGLKSRFLMKHEDSPIPSIASTTSLDTAQFTEYIEKVRRLAAELGCAIPDPGEY